MLVNAKSPGPSPKWMEEEPYAGILQFLQNLNVFKGDYDEFTVGWFNNVGTAITMTLLINVAEPHAMVLFYYVMMKIKICCCRRGTVMQHDLNALYTGFDFEPEVRYPQVRFLTQYDRFTPMPV